MSCVCPRRDLCVHACVAGRGTKRRASKDLSTPAGRSVGGARTHTLSLSGQPESKHAHADRDTDAPKHAQTHTSASTDLSDAVSDVSLSASVKIGSLVQPETKMLPLSVLSPERTCTATQTLENNTQFPRLSVRLFRAVSVTTQIVLFAMVIFCIGFVGPVIAQTYTDLNFDLAILSTSKAGELKRKRMNTHRHIHTHTHSHTEWYAADDRTRVGYALFWILVEGLSQDCMPLAVSVFVYYIFVRPPQDIESGVVQTRTNFERVRMPRNVFWRLMAAQIFVVFDLIQR